MDKDQKTDNFPKKMFYVDLKKGKKKFIKEFHNESQENKVFFTLKNDEWQQEYFLIYNSYKTERFD